MKKNVFIKDSVILINCDDEFAVLQRNVDSNGKQGITFSIPINGRTADLLNSSGIVEVESYNSDGLLVFKRRNFYEATLMIDLITDILDKYQYEKKYHISCLS